MTLVTSVTRKCVVSEDSIPEGFYLRTSISMMLAAAYCRCPIARLMESTGAREGSSSKDLATIRGSIR